MPEVGEVGSIGGDGEVEGEVEVGSFGGNPFFSLPSSSGGLLLCCDAGEVVGVEDVGVFFGPGVS